MVTPAMWSATGPVVRVLARRAVGRDPIDRDPRELPPMSRAGERSTTLARLRRRRRHVILRRPSRHHGAPGRTLSHRLSLGAPAAIPIASDVMDREASMVSATVDPGVNYAAARRPRAYGAPLAVSTAISRRRPVAKSGGPSTAASRSSPLVLDRAAHVVLSTSCPKAIRGRSKRPRRCTTASPLAVKRLHMRL